MALYFNNIYENLSVIGYKALHSQKKIIHILTQFFASIDKENLVTYTRFYIFDHSNVSKLSDFQYAEFSQIIFFFQQSKVACPQICWLMRRGRFASIIQPPNICYSFRIASRAGINAFFNSNLTLESFEY